jgi:predicted nucleic acid-binding protein
MLLLADSSAWSLAMRSDEAERDPIGSTLLAGLRGHHSIVVTGLVLQEVLQGLEGARARPDIISYFRYLTSASPTFDDHIAAADLRNHCRTRGVQVHTVDAVLAALCIRRDLTLLSADQDFTHIARLTPLRVWRPAA